MLYALSHPACLLVLLASFVVGMTLHGWVQAEVANRVGDARPRLEQRLKLDPRRHLEPFGVLAAAVSGLGWCKPVEVLDRRRRSAVLLVALSGPLVNIALGVVALVVARASFSDGYGYVTATTLQYGTSFAGASAGHLALLIVGASQLYLGVLSLVPIPPFDGGRLLFALAPQTLGWQRARHYLVDQNLGIVIALVALILPIGGNLLLPHILDAFLEPLQRAILGL